MTNFIPDTNANRVIRQYYEQNTRLFLTLGRQSRTHSMHRAVWAGDVRRLDAALNYTNELIRRQLLGLAPLDPDKTLRAADLGCGVGGSLFYMASRISTPFWGVGLTISPRQAWLAQRHAEQLGLQERCTFIEADFQHLPLAGGLEAAFSIEAFAHTPDAEGYLREASRLLRSGGRLMLCDDFLTSQGKQDNFWLHTFQRGWHVPGLSSAEDVKFLAQAYGLELSSELDLTRYLRLSIMPAHLARVFAGAGTKVRHLYLQSMAGGMALQQCYKKGLVSYRFLVFEKR